MECISKKTNLVELNKIKKCCDVFKVCLTFLEHYESKGLTYRQSLPDISQNYRFLDYSFCSYPFDSIYTYLQMLQLWISKTGSQW